MNLIQNLESNPELEVNISHSKYSTVEIFELVQS